MYCNGPIGRERYWSDSGYCCCQVAIARGASRRAAPAALGRVDNDAAAESRLVPRSRHSLLRAHAKVASSRDVDRRLPPKSSGAPKLWLSYRGPSSIDLDDALWPASND